MGQTNKPTEDPFWGLVATSQLLQAPGGCPWDRAQTLDSLLPCLVEEAWEVLEAARKHSHQTDALEEELGDLLYPVVFMAMRGEQAGRVSLGRMLARTREKMIRRHPHVFGNRRAKNARAKNAAEAYQSWQAVKQTERSSRKGPAKKFSRLLLQLWEFLLEEKGAETILASVLRKRSRQKPKPRR